MLIALVWICAPAYGAADHSSFKAADAAAEKAELVSPRISPDEAFEQMKAGNLRFAADKAIHPHTDLSRLKQAGTENQGNHAFATVLTCSDSRIPVERIFDAGIMDIFVVRVAGNVCNGDQAGSIEYGLAHVNTPLLVVMGHTQCGAVTAVAQALQGKAHTLERNIPGMIAGIEPAVKRVMQSEEGMNGKNLIDKAIEENVWQAIENLFLSSPRTRELVTTDKVKVVAAVYDVGTGRVRWLPDSKVYRLLGRTESDPKRAINAFADGGHGEEHAAAPKVSTIRAVAGHAAEPAHAESAHGEKPHGKVPEDSHGAAKPADPHKEVAVDTKKKPAAAPADKKVAEKNAHGDKADDKHGHGDVDKDKEDDKHGAAAKDDEKDKEDGHAEAAPAAPAKSKPWMLIGIAGGILVAGVVLMLMAMKGSKAAATAAAGAPAADAHGHAPAAH